MASEGPKWGRCGDEVEKWGEVGRAADTPEERLTARDSCPVTCPVHGFWSFGNLSESVVSSTPGGTRIPNLLIRSQRGAEQPHAWESVAITVFGLTRAVVTSGPRGV